MKITLLPSLDMEPITASIKGDIITINGADIDLSGIPEGYMLPGSAVANKYFVAQLPVQRVNGELSFGLVLPVFADTRAEWRNPPVPNVLSVQNGVVPFPDITPEVPEDDRPEPATED